MFWEFGRDVQTLGVNGGLGGSQEPPTLQELILGFTLSARELARLRLLLPSLRWPSADIANIPCRYAFLYNAL